MRLLLAFSLSLLLVQCTMTPTLNELGNSSSLYLRQHAENPVHWKMWSEGSLSKAKNENKLLVISIGYSSCHWCHVMEHESFEVQEVADVMNAHFVSIKVDREQRPDIDSRYMSAVQLMTGQGGWPLNVIALPDGTPVYGGTYFSREDWTSALEQIAAMWKNDPQRVQEYAEQMRSGLKDMVTLSTTATPGTFKKSDFQDVVSYWMRTIDPVHGGPNGAPKFPMPSNYQFLLDYALLQNDSAALDYTLLSLEKMALGGIFDPVHGGFTRYSTDRFWKVPHFEKMLYDNAQLIGLYARAYRTSKNPVFKETALEIARFLEHEMLLPSGLYAAALDADSETNQQREEGGFYTWTEDEISALQVPSSELMRAYFDFVPGHEWEHKYVPHRQTSDAAFAEANDIALQQLLDLKADWKSALQQASEKRMSTHKRPVRDEKGLTSWNALLVQGYYEAHLAWPNSGFDHKALALLASLKSTCNVEGKLAHEFSENRSEGHAFLDDYATFGNALICGYLLTGKSEFIQQAESIAKEIAQTFDSHGDAGFFAYNPNPESDWEVVIENEDNVIPSSGALCAEFFLSLSQCSGNDSYRLQSTAWIESLHSKVFKHGQSYSHWLQLAQRIDYGSREVVGVGENAAALIGQIVPHAYVPHSLVLTAPSDSGLPLTQYRDSEGQTLVYVCFNNTCQLPTHSPEKAIELWTH